MQNTQTILSSVELYTRDLRLTATEREQLVGLLRAIHPAVSKDITTAIFDARATAKREYERRNGDPDKEIAIGDPEDRVPIAIPASRP